MKSISRVLAAAFRSQAPAQSAGGLTLFSISLYTGYNVPKPSMIRALRWISVINVCDRLSFLWYLFMLDRAQPLRYAFESLVTNEFHTLDASCASFVPRGPGYSDISVANRVCTVVGSQPGQATVSGNRFVELSFQYSQSNLWKVRTLFPSPTRNVVYMRHDF
jgi:ATP-binding cassette subfamily G (WHITE) protein 2 (SNQ2)